MDDQPARAKGPLIDRERLLAEFDMLDEASVAVLLGIDVKTLKGRPLAQQPAFSKVGRDRLYHRKSVTDFLASTMVATGGRPPLFRRRPSVKAKTATRKAKAKPKASERAAV